MTTIFAPAGTGPVEKRFIEPPSEPGVELFYAVDVGNGDDDHLKLHIELCNARTYRLFAFAYFLRAHC